MTSQIIVVGGGAIGLSAAWELARRGERVTLVERDEVGKGTSWAATGILPPAKHSTASDPIDQLRGLSHELFPIWAEQLESLTGIDTGFRRCGGWYLAETTGELASMVGMTDYWRELGIVCQSVSLAELSRREPALRELCEREDKIAAWWTPDECQVRSPNYLQALRIACEYEKVRFVTHALVDDVRSSRSGTAVRTGQRWLEADAVVLCGGAWTGRIADKLRLGRSLVPIRGQILLLKSETPLLSAVVNVGNRYIVCRCDGHTLVGSCEEEVGFQTETTDEMLGSLHEFAVNLVPRLGHATWVRGWSGLRPMTFDGFPMIGRVPDTTNLFVAAGHYRSGLHLSPATAVTLADLMQGKPSSIDLDSFRVGKQQSTR